jgi:hypothetical protein
MIKLKDIIKEIEQGEYDPKPQMGKSTYYPKGHPKAIQIEKARQDAIKAQLLAKQQLEDLALKTKLMADYKKEHPAQKYREIHELEKQIAARREATKQAIEQERLAKENLVNLLEKQRKEKIAIAAKNSAANYDSDEESDSAYHYHQDLQARAARQTWEKNHHNVPFPYHLKPSEDIDINDIKTRAYQQQVIQYLQNHP